MVFLYTRLPDYFNECINAFASEKHLVVVKDRDNNAPYDLLHEKHVTVIKRSELNIYWVKRILKDESKHLYCAGWTDTIYLLIVILAKLKNFYSVIAIDNQYIGSPKQKLFLSLKLSRLLLLIFNFAWVPGPRQFRYASQIGFKQSDIFGGLYVASQRFRQKIKLDLTSFKVISIGRLVPYKNFDKLIRSIAHLVSMEVDCFLKIVGKGPEEYRLKLLVRELGLESRIEFMPFVQPQNLPLVYEGCSLFALVSDVEAHGLVVHEASCLGLPLIVTKGVGAGDLFVDRDNGFVVEEPCPKNIAEKMLAYFKTPLEEKIEMTIKSRKLGSKVDVESWINSLLDMRNQ